MGLLTSCNFLNHIVFGHVGWGIRCVPIPLFHVFGLGVGLICPLLPNSEKSVFPFYFPDTLSAMKVINSHKCHSISGPPTIMIDLLNHQERNNYDLSTLKKILMVIKIIVFFF